MKTLFAGLLFLALGTVAHASPFAGNYYAVSRNEYDQVDAGLNITVREDGTFFALGLDLYGEPYGAHGNVKTNGTIIFKERYDGAVHKEKGKLSADGQTLKILTVDDTIRGAKIAAGFPVAGVYKIALDEGDGGIFIVYSDGGVYGHLDGPSGGFDLLGKVTGNTFNGTSANYQVGFSGTIEGGTLTGTYGDNVFLSGTFSAEKL